MECVLRLLVPDELAYRLEVQRTRRMYNDLAELMYEELQTAIAGHESWRTDAFNWDAAKRRVEIVLEHYGASLPPPSVVTSYERRILKAYTA